MFKYLASIEMSIAMYASIYDNNNIFEVFYYKQISITDIHFLFPIFALKLHIYCIHIIYFVLSYCIHFCEMEIRLSVKKQKSVCYTNPEMLSMQENLRISSAVDR